jgi:hypothetical protein
MSTSGEDEKPLKDAEDKKQTDDKKQRMSPSDHERRHPQPSRSPERADYERKGRLHDGGSPKRAGSMKSGASQQERPSSRPGKNKSGIMSTSGEDEKPLKDAEDKKQTDDKKQRMSPSHHEMGHPQPSRSPERTDYERKRHLRDGGSPETVKSGASQQGIDRRPSNHRSGIMSTSGEHESPGNDNRVNMHLHASHKHQRRPSVHSEKNAQALEQQAPRHEKSSAAEDSPEAPGQIQVKHPSIDGSGANQQAFTSEVLVSDRTGDLKKSKPDLSPQPIQDSGTHSDRSFSEIKKKIDAKYKKKKHEDVELPLIKRWRETVVSNPKHRRGSSGTSVLQDVEDNDEEDYFSIDEEQEKQVIATKGLQSPKLESPGSLNDRKSPLKYKGGDDPSRVLSPTFAELKKEMDAKYTKKHEDAVNRWQKPSSKGSFGTTLKSRDGADPNPVLSPTSGSFAEFKKEMDAKYTKKHGEDAINRWQKSPSKGSAAPPGTTLKSKDGDDPNPVLSPTSGSFAEFKKEMDAKYTKHEEDAISRWQKSPSKGSLGTILKSKDGDDPNPVLSPTSGSFAELKKGMDAKYTKKHEEDAINRRQKSPSKGSAASLGTTLKSKGENDPNPVLSPTSKLNKEMDAKYTKKHEDANNRWQKSPSKGSAASLGTTLLKTKGGDDPTSVLSGSFAEPKKEMAAKYTKKHEEDAINRRQKSPSKGSAASLGTTLKSKGGDDPTSVLSPTSGSFAEPKKEMDAKYTKKHEEDAINRWQKSSSKGSETTLVPETIDVGSTAKDNTIPRHAPSSASRHSSQGSRKRPDTSHEDEMKTWSEKKQGLESRSQSDQKQRGKLHGSPSDAQGVRPQHTGEAATAGAINLTTLEYELEKRFEKRQKLASNSQRQQKITSEPPSNEDVQPQKQSTSGTINLAALEDELETRYEKMTQKQRRKSPSSEATSGAINLVTLEDELETRFEKVLSNSQRERRKPPDYEEAQPQQGLGESTSGAINLVALEDELETRFEKVVSNSQRQRGIHPDSPSNEKVQPQQQSGETIALGAINLIALEDELEARFEKRERTSQNDHRQYTRQGSPQEVQSQLDIGETASVNIVALEDELDTCLEKKQASQVDPGSSNDAQTTRPLSGEAESPSTINLDALEDELETRFEKKRGPTSISQDRGQDKKKAIDEASSLDHTTRRHPSSKSGLSERAEGEDLSNRGHRQPSSRSEHRHQPSPKQEAHPSDPGRIPQPSSRSTSPKQAKDQLESDRNRKRMGEKLEHSRSDLDKRRRTRDSDEQTEDKKLESTRLNYGRSPGELRSLKQAEGNAEPHKSDPDRRRHPHPQPSGTFTSPEQAKGETKPHPDGRRHPQPFPKQEEKKKLEHSRSDLDRRRRRRPSRSISPEQTYPSDPDREGLPQPPSSKLEEGEKLLEHSFDGRKRHQDSQDNRSSEGKKLETAQSNYEKSSDLLNRLKRNVHQILIGDVLSLQADLQLLTKN